VSLPSTTGFGVVQWPISRAVQGQRLGAALLQDAVRRAVAVAQDVGVRAWLVHSLHGRARQFYEHYGFQASPTHPLTLLLNLRVDRVP
jgi:GNAT superfamily N-acetyltransferase